MSNVIFKILEQGKCPDCHAVGQLTWMNLGEIERVTCSNCQRSYLVYLNTKTVQRDGE